MTKTMIRTGVFETNSSSSHSLSVDASVLAPELLPKRSAREGVIEVYAGEYGWEWYRYYDLTHKLSYLLTSLLPSEEDSQRPLLLKDETLEDMPEPVQLVCRLVKEHTGCDILFIGSSHAYIDHYSKDLGLKACNDTDRLKNLLFGVNSYIETGNDNSPPPKLIDTDRGPEPYYGKFYRELPKNSPRLVITVDLSIIPKFNRQDRVLVTVKGDKALKTTLDGALMRWLNANATVVRFVWRHYEDKTRSYLLPWHDCQDKNSLIGMMMGKLAHVGGKGLRFSGDLEVETKCVADANMRLHAYVLTVAYPKEKQAELQHILSKLKSV